MIYSRPEAWVYEIWHQILSIELQPFLSAHVFQMVADKQLINVMKHYAHSLLFIL